MAKQSSASNKKSAPKKSGSSASGSESKKAGANSNNGRPAAKGSSGGNSNSRQNGAAKSQAPAKRSGSNQSASRQANENSMLEKFFHDALKDIYWAEKALTKALPKMRKAATSQELKAAIEEHTAQTQEHVSRLEEVFQLLGKKAQAKKCDAMEGLIKEGESIVEETEDGTSTRDVGIIVSAQKVEHYEIATYGSLVQLATTMGEVEAADILTQTLEEEKQTDANLTELAEASINWKAQEEGEGEEDEEES